MRKVGYTGPVETLAAIRGWGARRYLAALAAGAGWLVLSGVPTDLVDTPLFVRMTPAEWWNYPLWVTGAVLVGLLVAMWAVWAAWPPARWRPRPAPSRRAVARCYPAGALLATFRPDF